MTLWALAGLALSAIKALSISRKENSQKVRTQTVVVHVFTVTFRGLVSFVTLLKVVVHQHHRCLIAHPVAVVRSRPNCYQSRRAGLVFPFKVQLVSFLNQLMGTDYQFCVVYRQELVHGLRTEEPACPTRVLLPAFQFFLWVRPHEIAKWSRWWNFDVSFDGADVVDGVTFRGDATMHAKDFPFNNGGDW